MTKKLLMIALLLTVSAISVSAQPKREFRGAWIQCVNGQFQNLGRDRMQQTLSYQLDELQKDGINAIIFQVRAECDALYASPYEPWSRFLTGQQGTMPSPYWDPLEWMTAECHKRGMEIHAWINPYRARTAGTKALASSHICVRHPELYFAYGEKGKELYILNPALKENRDYICEVSRDIVSRYDIDGFHIDDYFYPYPVAGQQIPDQALYQASGQNFASIGDWRRNNVDLFVKQLSETIHKEKPWVKFGVSPFGIYRNQKNDPSGSATNGLQNYDDLYADVLKWARNGWIDYCVPQIYWEIGNKAADYKTLIQWWDSNCSARPLYIGEDIERTAKHPDPDNPQQNQMPAKFRLHDEARNVQGTVLWYAKAAVDNVGNYGSMLRQHYWRYPALPPLMPFLDAKAPGKVRKPGSFKQNGQTILAWQKPKAKTPMDEASRYVVYRIEKGRKADLHDPKNILGVTYSPYFVLPPEATASKATYFVTALDHVGNEGPAQKLKVKK